MNDYEIRRLENIKRNKALVQQLGIPSVSSSTSGPSSTSAKRRKIERVAALPSRTSARIASAPVKVATYNEDEVALDSASRNKRGKKQTSNTTRVKNASNGVKQENDAEDDSTSISPYDIATLRASWTSWTPLAPPPELDQESGTYHFESHPHFTPNLSPASILRQGAFGGTYFRPYFSRTLRATIEDDWKELPAEWTSGLDVDRYLTSEVYNEEVNKFGVRCGQTIEEWEAAGWIRHEWDVRGWFQWYCRFWMGRRGDDDERQVGRWKKCCGETGRWRVRCQQQPGCCACCGLDIRAICLLTSSSQTENAPQTL